jgi:hypothetical protein
LSLCFVHVHTNLQPLISSRLRVKKESDDLVSPVWNTLMRRSWGGIQNTLPKWHEAVSAVRHQPSKLIDPGLAASKAVRITPVPETRRTHPDGD